MAAVLQESDNEFSSPEPTTKSTEIEIVGLSKEYEVGTPIKLQVKVNDSSLDCGDLYITIFEGTGRKNVISQNGYFDQCFVNSKSLIPLKESFSQTIEDSGKYEIFVEMTDKEQKQTISTSSIITVK